MHLAVLVLVATTLVAGAPTLVAGAPTLVAGAPTRHTRTPLKRDVLCPSADKTGAAFTASTTQEEAGNLFAVCSYGTSSVGCTYFTDGSFSAGGSSCPKGLVQNSSFEAGQGSSGNTNTDDGDTGSDTTPAPQQPPSQQPSSSGGSIDSSIECPSADDDGTPLTGSSKTNDDVGNEFALCTYQGAGPCTYFFADGSFSSGSSQCPNGQAQVDDSPASPPPATTPPPPATSTTPPPPPPPTTTPPAPETTTTTPVAPPPETSTTPPPVVPPTTPPATVAPPRSTSTQIDLTTVIVAPPSSESGTSNNTPGQQGSLSGASPRGVNLVVLAVVGLASVLVGVL